MTPRQQLVALDGLSAYEVAVARGFKGTVDEWLASLHGRDGVDGADGKSVDPQDIETLIRKAVDEIPRPADGKDGLRGEKGDSGRDGKDGKDAVLPPAVSHVATFSRDPETKLTLVMHVAPKVGQGQAWNTYPVWDESGVMTHADIIPV